MSKIVLITGDRRSGKSAFAESLALQTEGSRTYIATCPIIDDETRQRVDRHQKDREGKNWVTVEETIDLAGALKGLKDCKLVLIECVTLWINNLMYEAELRNETVSQDQAAAAILETLEVCKSLDSTILFVTNEVGGGIIPDNAAARNFSDLSGRVNQIIAAAADEVYHVVCGIPQKLK